MTLSIAENANLLRVVFLVGEISKVLAVGWDSHPSPEFPIKVQGKEGQSRPGGGKKAASREGTFLLRRGIHLGIILEYSPPGHCFVSLDSVHRAFTNKL